MHALDMNGRASEFEQVLEFWFGQLDQDGRASPAHAKRWFQGGPGFDAEVRERFSALYAALAAGGHADWLESPRGRLAVVLVLDQFPRNMFRGSPASCTARSSGCRSAASTCSRAYATRRAAPFAMRSGNIWSTPFDTAT
jgi:uncharacterized protein (DUF924 family)